MFSGGEKGRLRGLRVRLLLFQVPIRPGRPRAGRVRRGGLVLCPRRDLGTHRTARSDARAFRTLRPWRTCIPLSRHFLAAQRSPGVPESALHLRQARAQALLRSRAFHLQASFAQRPCARPCSFDALPTLHDDFHITHDGHVTERVAADGDHVGKATFGEHADSILGPEGSGGPERRRLNRFHRRHT